MKNHAGISPVSCEPATLPHRGILLVWESSQSKLLVVQLPYQASNETVCSSVFLSPAATNRVLRVVLRCTGRSKPTHESTRSNPSHRTPVWNDMRGGDL